MSEALQDAEFALWVTLTVAGSFGLLYFSAAVIRDTLALLRREETDA